MEHRVSSAPLQVMSIACVLYVTALPGFLLGLRGGWWINATIITTMALVAAVAGELNLLRFRVLKRWQPWILTYAGASLLAGTLFVLQWAVSRVAKDIFRFLTDVTISRSSGIFLLITIGTTAVIWTALSFVFIAATFVYARLLGHFAASIADHAFPESVDDSEPKPISN